MEIQYEKDLVERAKNDPDAFSELFDFYYPKILNYSLRRLGNIDVSKDITSQVFFKVLNKLPKFTWDISFSSWVYKIATNEIYDFYRSPKNKVTSLEYLQTVGFEPEDLHDIETELIAAEQEVERHQLFLEVQKHLLQLDLSYQEIISLKYFEKKKIKEIAEITGKKEGTVKSLLSRGLEKLRSLMLNTMDMQLNREKNVIKVKAE
jgi:RNA polymerase sigma-70 factor, ECF subfamily